MKKFFVALSLCVTTAAFAQTITLQQAIQTGLKNRLEIRSQNIGVNIAQSQNKKTNATWYPQLTFNGDLRWNTRLQQSLIPIGEFGLPGTPPDAKRNVAFGAPFNNQVSFDVNQKIFDPKTRYDRNINRINALKATNELESIRVSVKQSITETYYLAIYNREKLQLSLKAYERAKANVQTAYTKYNSGTLLKNDLNRFVLDSGNARLAYDNDLQNYGLSLSELQYQLNVSEKYSPAETLKEIVLNSANTESNNLDKRTEIVAEGLSRKINEQNRAKEKTRYLPVISGYGSLGALQLSQNLNLFGKDTWSSFNYFGLKLSWTLFDGFQAKHNQEEFRQRAEINQLNSNKLKNDFDFEVRESFTQLDQAKRNLQDAEKNILLAEEILITDKLRFAEGVITSINLIESEYALRQAENSYLTQAYNFLIASVRHQRALGNL